MTGLKSPKSGRLLRADGDHALTDGCGERWPVVDGIPYLRAGSAALAAAVLDRLDHDDREGALVLLLAENDSWWDEPPPPEDALRVLVREAGRLTLREFMARLGWGRVGDYFAHRWSDPTFIAALALTDAHWTAPQTVFELGCGIGHHLRSLQQAGCSVAGGDVVFAKLWVARHFLVGASARLICFDAQAPWPVTESADLIICHDAFYFFAEKPAVAERMRSLAGKGGVLLSHVHNRAWPTHSPDTAMGAEELQNLFPGAVAYDDAELTRAAATACKPCAKGWKHFGEVEAISLAWGACACTPIRPADGPVSRPHEGTDLVRNPLLGEGGIAWPSDRYQREYGSRATYGRAGAVPARARMSPALAALAASRELVDLPERW